MLDALGPPYLTTIVKLHARLNMIPQTPHSPRDNGLLLLGILSFLFYPFTAVPGIILARRRALSSRGQLGYALCLICLGLFCIHLLLLGTLILQGRAGH
jgi:hypothetical protein